MSELIVWPLVIAAGGTCCLLGLWRVGVLASPAVTSWNRIGRHHSLIDPRPLPERWGDRVPFLKAMYREANVPRLLAIAGRPESGTAWATRTLGLSLAAAVLTLASDWFLGRPGHLPLSAGLALLPALVGPTLGYLDLRRAARQRQERLQNALSQSLSELAILTFNGQTTIDAALRLVARGHVDGTLHDLLKDDGWRSLTELREVASEAGRALTSTSTIYEGIGLSYDVPMFVLLASGMRRINDKGMPARRMLTSLARTVGEARLAEMAVRAEQARVRLAIPIGLMVVPLLILLGYPSIVAITAGFSR